MPKKYVKALRNLHAALDQLRTAAASASLRDPGAVLDVPGHHWDMPHLDSDPGHLDFAHLDGAHIDGIHLDGYNDSAHDDAFHDDQGHDDGGHDDEGHDDGGHDDGGHDDGGHDDQGHDDGGHEDQGHNDDVHGDEGHEDDGERPWDDMNRLINELDTVLQLMQRDITHAFEQRMVQHAEQSSVVLAALAARIEAFDARLRLLERQGKDTP